MSKFKDLIEQFKKTLANIHTEDAFTVSAEDLVISEMKIGGKVEAKDTEGNVVPAPNGEYTVGSDVIEVKDGFIVTLNGDKEAAPEEQMADEAPAEDTPDVAALQAQVDSMATEIETLKAAIEEMKKTMSADTSKEDAEKFSKQLQELNDTIKLLITTPAEFSKTNESIVVKDDKEVRTNEWTSALAKAFKNN